MAQYVIWIDSNKAEIFNLATSGIEKTQFKKHGPDHHTFNKNDHHGDPTAEHFYHDVMKGCQDAEEILILGPSFSKLHFKTYLESHAPQLAKKIIGLEDSDHPTDNQILATARKFFKSYNLFNHPIRP